VTTALRPFGPPPHFPESYVELPLLSVVIVLRPVERAVNPSSPNGFSPEYQ
jgi:hypothetical protein